MFEYKEPATVVREMNALGAARVPFLFAFDYELQRALLVAHPLQQDEVLFSVRSVTNRKTVLNHPQIALEVFPMDYDRYSQGFDVIRRALMRGDSYLANYTVKTPIQMNASLLDVFNASRAPYCLHVPDQFVCFSPERFVHIHKGVVSTHPMKGTIDASVPDAEQVILADAKETAEHVTVVDLLRNDIGMVSSSVNVSRFRYIDRIDTPQRSILQVSSEIQGVLHDDWRARLGDILWTLMPAGSICGAPKDSTVRAIATAEQQPRGFYTGVFGYFDGTNLDSAVLIRFIEQEEDRLFFRSGGGITVNSSCRSEYNEVNQKIYIPV